MPPVSPIPANAAAASEALEEQRRYPHWQRNRLALPFTSFCQAMGFGLSFPFLPLILRELGVRQNVEEWVGYLVGAYFTLSFFLMPMWGVVADHYGRKAMVLRTSLGMALVYLLLPFAPSLGMFLALFMLLGTTNGLVAAVQALVATTTPTRRMGSALSAVQTGSVLGTTLGPALGALLANLLPSYRDLYWCSAAASALGGLIALVYARESFERPAARFRPHLLRDLRVILRIPDMPLFYVVFAGYTVTFNGSVAIVSVYALQLLAAEGIFSGQEINTWVGAVSIAMPIGSVLASQVWGRLLDRLGPGTVLIGGLLSGGLAVLGVMIVQSPVQLVGARFLVGLLAIGIGPAAITLVRGRSPPGMESRVLANLTACGMLGMGLGPFIAGQMGPVLGLRSYWALNCALLMLAVLALRRALKRGEGREPGA